MPIFALTLDDCISFTLRYLADALIQSGQTGECKQRLSVFLKDTTFLFSFSVIKWQDPDQLQSLRPQGHHAACSDPDHISCSWPRSTNCINVLPRLEIFANQNAAVHTHLLSVSIIRRPIPSTHTDTHTQAHQLD